MTHGARIAAAIWAILSLWAMPAPAQTADSALLAEIHRIKAIDNHSHPPRVVSAGERDDEFDALPCYPLEPTPTNVTLRPENPMYLAAVLRDWLEAFQEKVLFGTDLFPGDGAYDWEEIGWQTAETGRTALAIALTGMMQDGEITRARAIEIARLVLRGNAFKLYGWSERP